MDNAEVELIQNKALKYLEPFEKFKGTLDRLTNMGKISKTIEYLYVPVDKTTMKKLLELKLQADSILDEDGKKNAFYKTMKLIKPESTIT